MINLGYSEQNLLLSAKENNKLTSTRTSIDILQSGVEYGIELLKDCARNNLVNLAKLLTWNHMNNIHVFVAPTQLFPYASDGYFGYSTHFATFELQFLGNMCREFRQRIIFSNPSEHCNLGSLQQYATLQSKRSLHTIASILQYFPDDCMLITTIAGKEPRTSDEEFYGNDEETLDSISKAETLERWCERFTKLPDFVKKRIALQNDPFRYTINDLLPICKEYNIPLCPHTLYDSINGQQAHTSFPAIRETWEYKGVPIIFHGESNPGAYSIKEKLQESLYVNDFPGLSDTMDVVLLSAAKEQSIFNIYEHYDFFVDSQLKVQVQPKCPIQQQHEEWKSISE